MKLHRNAALSWHGRRRLVQRVVEQGWTLTAAAAAAGVSVRCARKWVGRYRLEGDLGLHDRSSAPRRVANRTASERVEAIAKLRRLRFTAAEIAETLGMALSTVSGILTRLGVGRLGLLGLEQPLRYERSRPGELVHIDVKKLGKIARPGHRVTGRVSASGHHRRRYDLGWEFVHVAVDDYSRLAYAEVLADEKATTIVSRTRRAARPPRAHARAILRVMPRSRRAPSSSRSQSANRRSSVTTSCAAVISSQPTRTHESASTRRGSNSPRRGQQPSKACSISAASSAP
jgi:transposase